MMTTDAPEKSVAQEQPHLLCVDDEQNILKSLRRLLMQEAVQIHTASSGQEALDLMQQQQFDVIISDMRMPGMDGAEFLRQAFAMQPKTYRILMTGYADIQSTVAAVNEGRINRYIAKPWNNQELITSIQDGIQLCQLQRDNDRLQQRVLAQNQQLKVLNQDLERRVELRTEQLKQTLQHLKVSMGQTERTNQALLKVLYNQISMNPSIDGRFAIRVSSHCKAVARQLGLPKQQQENAGLAGMLCEIGLSGLSPQLVAKPLHLFDSNDWQRYREHARFAEEILTPAVALAPVTEMIRHQYELFAGNGFPDQLSAERIPVGARILAAVRDFHGFIGGRLLGRNLAQADAMRMLRQQQGAVYDPQVLIALQEIVARGVTDPMSQLNTRQGLSLDELQEGMKLKSNVYNQKNMLLVPEGTVLTTAMIAKLRKLLPGQQDQLRFLVEPPSVDEATTG